MPTSKSAKKRMKQNEQRRLRNRAGRNALKTQVRKVREALDAKNLPQAEAELRQAAKKLDQTAAKGIVHRNLAARVKSRLSAAVKRAKGK
jgi:small subunit ribosomal protein S20